MRNKKNLIIIFILFFIYISFSLFSYINFTGNIDNYYSKMQNNLNSVQNVIFSIYSQNLVLYQILLTNNINDFNKFKENVNVNVTGPLLNYLVNSKFNQKVNLNVSSNLKNYFSIGILRREIINLHKLNLISTQKNYKKKLQSLLGKYNILVKKTVEEFNSNLIQIKLNNLEFKQNLKKSIFLKFLILSFIYIILSIFILLLYGNDKNNDKNQSLKNEKNLLLLDKDLQNILNFIKKEKIKGYVPTIKDIKKEMNITHPTILNKLKILSSKNYIEIKKKGRNKYIILK